jgi:dipeptidyl aminopeptidase/acylaminoacyl peptidase
MMDIMNIFIKRALHVTVVLFLFLLLCLTDITCSAQQSPDILKAYKRAKTLLPGHARSLINNVVYQTSWQKDGRLVYRNKMKDGVKFMVVAPSTGNKKELLNQVNQQKLKAAIYKITGTQPNFGFPRIQNVQLSKDNHTLKFSLRSREYSCNLTDYTCENEGKAHAEPLKHSVVSPDGNKAVYIKDWNLWMENLKTGEVEQLTRDGEKYNGFGTNNNTWATSKTPVVRWSPDSKRIATFQLDTRKSKPMYLVKTKVGHPELIKWKAELPGDPDSLMFKVKRVIINLKPEPEVVRLKMPPDFERSVHADEIAKFDGTFLDTQWSPNSQKLAFMSVNRDFTKKTLRIADAKTGNVRTVMHERVKYYFAPGVGKKFRVLFKSNEVIWYSQRSNWGHLYLYNLKTGKLKNQIGSGKWNMLDEQYIDTKNRKIYFIGSCKHEGNPYFQYLYSIDFSGNNMKLLTPETANHQVTVNKNGHYFVDTYSTPAVPPVTVVRNMQGKKMMTLAKADISALRSIGWNLPAPFTVKGPDGKTNLYGLMFKPSDFDPSKSYPIIDYVYPGPQAGSIYSWSFQPSQLQALAEMGFIVVEVNSMGGPGRSKAFQTHWYGNFHINGVPSQVTAIKQLAERHSWIDIDKVGIWGHSGGGDESTTAILSYPDFFKVAWSESGNHDKRNYESAWGDKYQGLLKPSDYAKKHDVKGPYVKGDNYDIQANENYVENLKGHLMLVVGSLDANVTPYNTLLVVNALVKAHKNFDMLIIPNAGHGFGSATDYVRNRRWAYFVKHLKGINPPKNFVLKGYDKFK